MADHHYLPASPTAASLERALHWTYELIQVSPPEYLDKLRSIHLSIGKALDGVSHLDDTLFVAKYWADQIPEAGPIRAVLNKRR